MAINAGTILATLDMDTSGFSNALQLAQSQATAFARDGGGVSAMIDGIGAASATVGRALSMGVTAPLAGIGVAAVKTGMDFDAQMSRVQAISGASAEEFAGLRAAAIQMGADSVFGATDAAQALEYMGMAGWKTEQMIAGLPGVINLAAASGENLGTVSDIVTDALTAFGLQASDSAHFADVLAAASTNSNTNVGLMGETFKYVAPLAGSLGYSVEDTALAIGLMANAGIKGGQAGTALRGMLTRLSKPTDEVATAMERYGISLTDTSGQMLPLADVLGNLRGIFNGLTEAQKVELAATLAGQEGMSGLLAIVNASEADYNKLAGAITNSAGATQRMADLMLNNLKGDLEGLSGALEGVALAFADYITPAIRTVVQWVTKAVDWFNGLSDGARDATFRVAGIAAAAGPLLLVGGKLISAFSPILPLAAGIGGGLALVYNHSERVRGTIEKLKTNGPAAFDAIKDGISRYNAQMERGLSRTQAIKSVLETALGADTAGRIMETADGIAGGLEKIRGAVRAAADGVGAFAGGLIDGKGAAASFAQGLEAAFGEGATVKSIGNALANGLKKGIASARTKLRGAGETLIQGLGLTKAKLEGVASKAMTWLGDAWRSGHVQDALGELAGVGRTMLDKLSAGRDALNSRAGDLLQSLGDALGSPEAIAKLGNLAGVAARIAEKLTSGFGGWKTAAAELLGGLVEQLSDSGFLEAALTGLSDVATAIARGIGGAAGNMAAAATELLQGLAGALTKPGMLDGILTNAGDIVTSIGETIIGAADSIIPAATELISTLAGKLTESGFVSGLFTTAATVVEEIGGQIAAAAPSIVGCATELITELAEKLSETNFVSGLFTTAATVVTEIAKAIGDNADSIAGAAGELAASLLDGLSQVEWQTVGTTLGTALGNLCGAIFNWFTTPGNLQKLWDAGVEIAKSLLLGFAEGLLPGTIYIEPEVEPNFSMPEGYEMEQAVQPTAEEWYRVLEGVSGLFSNGGELWAASLNVGFQQKLNTLDMQQSLIAAAMLMASGFGESVRGVAPELAATVSEVLSSIGNAASTEEVKSGFAALGYQITGELADAILAGQTDVGTAIGALGAGMNSDMILAMDQMALKAYLKEYFEQTGTEISELLQTSATDWGKIFGQAIPDGATIGLENGMYLLRSATGEVIKEVSAVNAEAEVKAGNQSTAEAGMAAMKTGIENKEGSVKTAAQGAVDAIMEPVDGMEATSKADTDAMMSAVRLAIEEGTPAATAAIDTASRAVLDAARSVLSEGAGKTLGMRFVQAIGNGISGAAGGLTGTASGAATSAMNAIRSGLSGGYGLGLQMIDSVASGVRAGAGRLASAMRQAASRAVSAFRGALDMHSPSRILVNDGMLMAASVGIGVERNTAHAARSMVRLARAMADAWPQGVETDGWSMGGGSGAGQGGADPSGAQGGIVINNNGPITIREEADIEHVAAELYELIREEKRGG